MGCSPARLAANRANARKSTGPRTPEGKAASRANALKHGLTGNGTALAPEDQAALDRHLATWKATHPPTGPDDLVLLRQLAVCCLQIDAAQAIEARIASTNRERDLALYNADRDLAALELFARLADDPETTAHRLRRNSHGCWLLADRWTALRHGLDADRCRWTDADLSLALGLLGLPHATRHLDETATALTGSAERARAGDPAACTALRARIDEQLEALSARAVELEETVDASERAALEEGGAFDFGPEAERVRRYQRAAWRQFWKLLDELDEHQRTRLPLPRPRPQPVPPPRPPAAIPSSPPAPTVPAPPKVSLNELLRPAPAILSTTPPPPARRTQSLPFTVTRPRGLKPSERR